MIAAAIAVCLLGSALFADAANCFCADDSTPYLTLDGVYVDGASSGGTIKLEIRGLSAGTHTLTTWHSFFDNVEGSSMSVTVNGKVTATGVPGPTRVRNDADAGISYSVFEVSEGQTVEVLIASENNNTYKNAVLNAFEIDGENPLRGIRNAVPADEETHHQEEAGLTWEAADGATAHDVYLGTSYAAVCRAAAGVVSIRRS